MMSGPSKLSVIIPAYQEEKRIGITMSAISTFLNQAHPGAEVIVVCDGCTDNTPQAARAAFVSETCQLKVVELERNQGKGNAVRTGMLEATGDYLFFTDADLSFAPELIDLFLAKLTDHADIAIAQRTKKTTYPQLGRRVLAATSRFIVGNIILPGIRDTQAGLKGFRAPAAKYLFKRVRTKGFLFDLEILMIARAKGYRIEKLYVDWQDRAGSTVRLFLDSLRAARDLLLICLNSLLGRYDIHSPE